MQALPDITENSNANIYGIVRVEDKDKGIHGQIKSLDIVDGDPDGHFRIRPTNKAGEYNIEIHRLLDRESTPQGYNLTLRAIDRGVPPKSGKWKYTYIVVCSVHRLNVGCCWAAAVAALLVLGEKHRTHNVVRCIFSLSSTLIDSIFLARSHFSALACFPKCAIFQISEQQQTATNTAIHRATDNNLCSVAMRMLNISYTLLLWCFVISPTDKNFNLPSIFILTFVLLCFFLVFIFVSASVSPRTTQT